MTEIEQKVYECVQAQDDGRGLSAIGYYSTYGSNPDEEIDWSDMDAVMKMFERNDKEKDELGLTESEFTEVLDSLAEQGYISKIMGRHGEALYTKTITVKGLENRSNAMYSIESKFKSAEKSEIIETAKSSFRKVGVDVQQMKMDDSAVIGILLLCIRLGALDDGVLGDEEKGLINTLFKSIYNGSQDGLYDMTGEPITDDDYDMLSKLIMLGDEFAIDILNLILAVAYIDGKFNDEVAKRIDSIYGLIFLKTMFSN